MKLSLGRLTVLAGMLAFLAFAISSGLESGRKDAYSAATAARERIDEAYNEAHPGKDAARYAAREDYWAFAEKHAPGLVKQHGALLRKADALEHGADMAKGSIVIIAGLYLLAALAFGIKAAAGRTQTRGQRAGLALACGSLVPLLYYLLRHGAWGFRRDFIGSDAGAAFFVLAGAGALLLLRLPQRLFAWIAGGRKD